jgi:hypothetical protein
MLRLLIVLAGVALLLVGIGSFGSSAHRAPGVMFCLLGGLVLVGTLFERYRYKALDDTAPGPGWTETGERFFDPGSGDFVTVFTRSRDGARRYIRTPAPNA